MFVILLHFLFYSLCEARLVWKNDIKIRSSNFEDDLERIPSKLLASLGLLVDISKMERFDSLANSQPEVREEYKEVPLKEYDYQIDYGEEDYGKNPSRKRLADGNPDYDTTLGTFINGTVNEVDYNLNEFKKDYDNRLPEAPEIASVLPISNMSVMQSQDDRPFEATETKEYSESCLKMSLWKYICFGIPCLLQEILHIANTGKFVNIIIFFLKTVLVVFPSLFVLFLSCWCYNGMCSCLFPHEFFHPYREIIKIKKEAYRLPPGVYVDEEGRRWNYTPSEEEKQVYEELLKLIRS